MHQHKRKGQIMNKELQALINESLDDQQQARFCNNLKRLRAQVKQIENRIVERFDLQPEAIKRARAKVFPLDYLRIDGQLFASFYARAAGHELGGGGKKLFDQEEATGEQNESSRDAEESAIVDEMLAAVHQAPGSTAETKAAGSGEGQVDHADQEAENQRAADAMLAAVGMDSKT